MSRMLRSLPLSNTNSNNSFSNNSKYLQQSSTPGTSSLTSVGGTTLGSNNIGTSAAGPQNFPFAAQRRAQLAQQGLGGMSTIRLPGKTGLIFDLILSRIQGKLQKNRETGAELTSLAGSMNEIHDTLGGNLVGVNTTSFFSPLLNPSHAACEPSSTSQFTTSSSTISRSCSFQLEHCYVLLAAICTMSWQ